MSARALGAMVRGMGEGSFEVRKTVVLYTSLFIAFEKFDEYLVIFFVSLVLWGQDKSYSFVTLFQI